MTFHCQLYIGVPPPPTPFQKFSCSQHRGSTMETIYKFKVIISPVIAGREYFSLGQLHKQADTQPYF